MKKTLLVLGIITLLLLVACSSNELPKVESNNDQIVTQSNNNDNNNDNQIKLNVEDQEPQEEEVDIKKVFEDLVAKGESADFKVDYKTTSNVQGEVQVMQSTWFLKDKNFRMDTKGDVEGQSFESRMITTEDMAIMCTLQGSWVCYNLGISPEEAQEQQEGQAEMLTPEDIELEMNVYSSSDRKIAGTTAKCFKVNVEQVSSEFCYSKEGVPLYFETNAEGIKMVQEATSYSKSVSNNDFEPPAKVQDMQEMLNGMMQG